MGADEVPDDVHNITQDRWYYTIHDAIEHAENGDELVAKPRTYYEMVDFGGKAITLRSTEPDNWGVVESTIIDVNDLYVIGANFDSGEPNSAALKGFTIRHGCYGVRCINSSAPVVSNCIIENNYWVGYVAGSSGTATPRINNCIIRNNGSLYWGIYVNASNCEIKNNLIYNNATAGIYLSGSQTVSILNNTIVGHTTYGIRKSGTAPTISNCILWNNGDDLYNCTATYSCIEDNDSGIGNIHSDPLFIDPDNDDYHISSDSPCRDAGDPNYTASQGEIDIDNESRIVFGRIDMGADEIPNKVYNVTRQIWYHTIQDAIDNAYTDNEIVVYSGTYYENVVFNENVMTVVSTEPDDWDVVGSTIIDGSVSFQSGQYEDTELKGFTIRNGDYGIYSSSSRPLIQNCIIENNWYGVYAETAEGYTSMCPVIHNDIIRNNDTGIYIATHSIQIKDNLIYGNETFGILIENLQSNTSCNIENNTIVGNDWGGMVMQNCESEITLLNCILWNNGDDLFGCSAIYSCVENGDSGDGNISSNPQFVDPNNGDYHITSNSPCKNAGYPYYYPGEGETDIDGDGRIYSGRIDMGADEWTGS